MKPQLSLSPAPRSARYDGLFAKRRFCPLVEHQFQPDRFGDYFGGGDSPRRRPNFSALANEVLRTGANRSFRLESAVLAFIALVTAWPIVTMIHEVIRLIGLIFGA